MNVNGCFFYSFSAASVFRADKEKALLPPSASPAPDKRPAAVATKVLGGDGEPLAGKKRVRDLGSVRVWAASPTSPKRERREGAEGKPETEEEPACGGAGKRAEVCERAVSHASSAAPLLVEELPAHLACKGEGVRRVHEAAKKTSQRVKEAVALMSADSVMPQLIKVPCRKGGEVQVAVISRDKAYMLKRKRLLGEGAEKEVYLVKDAFTKSLAASYETHSPRDCDTREVVIMRALAGNRGIIQLLAEVPHSPLPPWAAYQSTEVILPFYNKGSLKNLMIPYMDEEDEEGSYLEEEPKAPIEISIEDKTDLTRQIILGLYGMHRKGYIHRDIKPENILIECTEGRWMAAIADFGLTLHDSESSEKEYEAGSWLWYSPEYQTIVNSRSPRDFSKVTTFEMDIYALGLTLFAFLATSPVNIECDKDELISKMEESHKDVPANIQNIIKLMLAKDPLKRTWKILLPVIQGVFPA